MQNIRGDIKENYNLAHLTWFKVGGEAELFFKPKDQQDLVAFLKNYGKDITVIGAGSNMIVRDLGIAGAVIKLTREFCNITELENSLLVGAGCLNFNLAKFAQMNSIAGFEFLVGIPGCVGGGVVMNAGSYGSEFKDIILKVYGVDFAGNDRIFEHNEIKFEYRSANLPKNLVITAVEFKKELGTGDAIGQRMQEISAMRANTQPITEKTGGSSFANPPGHKAWQLIDKVGMRGYRVGGARFSEQHCNFIINDGTATAKDIEDLGELARKKVQEQEGIELKWEIKRIGRQ